MINATKKDFIQICIKNKNCEKKIINIIKNKIKPYSLIKSSQVKDFASAIWEGLDELVEDNKKH